MTGKYTSSLFAGGAADVFTFTTGSTGSSILAGSGNDSVPSVVPGARCVATPTTSVRPTVRTPSLRFLHYAGTGRLPAVDAAYGATSGIQYSGDLDAGTGTSGTITFNNAESGVATGTRSLTTSLASSELLVLVLLHHLRHRSPQPISLPLADRSQI